MKTLTVVASLALALSPAAAGEPADDDPAGKLLEPLKKGSAAYGPVAFTLLTQASGKDEAARQAALEAIDRLGPFDAPFARNLAVVVGHHRGHGRLQACLQVRLGHGAYPHRSVGLAQDAHQATHGQTHQIGSLVVGVGPGLAERRDGGQDDVRLDSRQVRIAQSKVRHVPGSKGFHHKMGGRH